jgi:transposase-like protein
VLQEALEAEMSDALGTAKSERTTGRLGYRSGYYSRTPAAGRAAISCAVKQHAF